MAAHARIETIDFIFHSCGDFFTLSVQNLITRAATHTILIVPLTHAQLYSSLSDSPGDCLSWRTCTLVQMSLSKFFLRLSPPHTPSAYNRYKKTRQTFHWSEETR